MWREEGRFMKFPEKNVDHAQALLSAIGRIDATRSSSQAKARNSSEDARNHHLLARAVFWSDNYHFCRNTFVLVATPAVRYWHLSQQCITTCVPLLINPFLPFFSLYL
jgi:hypothetical protein